MNAVARDAVVTLVTAVTPLETLPRTSIWPNVEAFEVRHCRLAHPPGKGETMDQKKDVAIRIDLTESQKQMIRDATGKELDALEFTAEALEDRVAPARLGRGIRL